MPGKKFSGVTTLPRLKARCKVDRKTGCWHYTGAVREGQGGAQLWVLNPAKGAFEKMNGARGVATIMGKEIPAGGRAWMKCRNEDCCCPDHVLTGTVAEWGAFYREHKIWVGSAARVAAVRASARARSPLDSGTVREIRNSEDDGPTLAARYGVCRDTVSRVRTGRRWADPNPFTGLVAR